MADYQHSEIRGLEADLLYTPPSLRRRHIQRLERLIPEIVPAQLYTYEYIFYRITLFRPDPKRDGPVSGRVLHHDLCLLMRRLSPAVPLNAAKTGEPVLPLGLAAAQCRVTPNTIRRWGLQGLAICYYVLGDGRRGWAVRRSSLRRFLSQRAGRVGRRVRRVNEEERNIIVTRARTLSARSGLSVSAVIRRLAEEQHRSPETVRRVLRRYDRRNRNAPIFPVSRPGLTPQQREELVRLYRGGTSARQLARRFRRSASAIYRVLHLTLLDQALSLHIRYMPSPEFAGRNAEMTCLSREGLFTYPPEATPDMSKAPAGVPPYLKELYSVPLLTRAQEKMLFRKYNYIKYRLALLQEKIRRSGYRARMMERFEEVSQAAQAVRRILIRCNLRLVVSIAKRHTGPLANLFELVSAGNVCLMRTVECYDYTRNARFATYATWAISKHFARIVPEENYRLATFITGQQEMITSVGDSRPDPHERSEAVAHLRAIIARASEHLTERERIIIYSHFGTDGRPARTLEQIGKLFGLTRERIRQIEARALGKLRSLIAPEALEGVT